MTEPIAVQGLDKDYKLERYTFCPTHNNKTSDYVGISKDDNDVTHMLFRCKEGHMVSAIPDKNMPKTVDDLAKWMEKQRQAVFAESQGKTKGKG